MNVYIEGPDATGKTTLANWLSNKFGMQVEHLTADSPNTYDYHLDCMKKDNMIYDRFCMGEVVYSKIYGRIPKLTLEDCVHILQKVMEKEDIFVVFVTSDIDVLKKRLIARGEEHYLAEIEEQNKEYIALAYALQALEYEHFYVYDIAKGYEGFYEVLKEVIECHGVQ